MLWKCLDSPFTQNKELFNLAIVETEQAPEGEDRINFWIWKWPVCITFNPFSLIFTVFKANMIVNLII